MQFSALVALLPALVPMAQAYFILSQPILETTRLDPIVNPGTVSGHVHAIAGSSSFDKSMSYASSRAGQCTTAAVSVDHSNYWIPQLYYYEPKAQTYQAIPADYMNAYYLNRPGKVDTKVHAFPDGLRMISGSPDRRTFTSGDPNSEAISYVCLDYSGTHTNDPAWAQRNNFFSHNCPQGMRAQVNFPNCWDGVNLDSDDHKSHVAWPSGGVDGGDCPASHPVHLVSLFYEFIFRVQDFPYNTDGSPTYVWANGDASGYGLHADFINGWPSLINGTNVLQQAIDQCNDNDGVGGVLSNCPPFVPYLDQASANACQPENAQVDEDVGFGHALASLPGDNPLWVGTNTTKPTDPSADDGNSTFSDFKSVIPAGFSYTGCIAEATSGRALTAKSFSNANMTRGACVDFCASFGYPLAGVEYSQECYCDVALRNGATNATLLAESKCGMACANNTYENCGGAGTLTLYNNPSLYPAPSNVTAYLPAGWSYSGCIAEGSTGRALTGKSFANDNMTRAACAGYCGSFGFPLAGVEYGRECYCGSGFSNGATNTTLLSADKCSMTCANAATQQCGGPNALSLFNNPGLYPKPAVSSSSSSAAASSTSSKAAVSSSSAVASSSVAASSSTAASSSAAASSSVAASSSSSKAASSSVASSSTTTSSTSTVSASPSPSSSPLPSGWSFSGCIAEGSSGRALAAKSTSGSGMTQATCMNFCASYGYPLAGVEYASECYCDLAFRNGGTNTTFLDASKCSMSCAGDSTQKCGGSNALSLFNNPSLYPQPKTLPAGWSANGCMTEASSGRALKAYSFTSSSMTQELCMTTCGSKGYKYAGVEYAGECYCGNQFEAGSVAASSGDCSMSCSGDKTSLCGGGNRLTTFVNPSAGVSSSVSSSSTTTTSATSTSTSKSVTTTTAAPTTTTTTTTTTAAASTTSSAYVAPTGYVGCFSDASTRTLNGTSYSNDTGMTNEACISFCGAKGYEFAGTEYSRECYCGNYLNLANTQTASNSCQYYCMGEKRAMCGGSWQLSVFDTGVKGGVKYGTAPASKRGLRSRASKRSVGGQ